MQWKSVTNLPETLELGLNIKCWDACIYVFGVWLWLSTQTLCLINYQLVFCSLLKRRSVEKFQFICVNLQVITIQCALNTHYQIEFCLFISEVKISEVCLFTSLLWWFTVMDFSLKEFNVQKCSSRKGGKSVSDFYDSLQRQSSVKGITMFLNVMLLKW